MAVVTGITGGIGSGKSIVSAVVKCLGYRVYDCDSRAKTIVDSDISIKSEIARQIGLPSVRDDGSIDRAYIASVVFNDAEKLAALNGIVHEAVRNDLSSWIKRHSSEARLFVECAILYTGGIDRFVDNVWCVTAPEALRIDRVCARNGISPDEVKRRMQSQACETIRTHIPAYELINDGCKSVLLQIAGLLKS